MRKLLLILITASLPSLAQTAPAISGGTLYGEWTDDMTSMPATIRIITPATPPAANRPPLQTVIVMDASDATPAELFNIVKGSARAVCDNLADRDLCGVVAYNRTTTTAVTLQPLSSAQRSNVAAAIGRVPQSGGRNPLTALRAAARLFDAVKGQEYCERSIVLIVGGAFKESDPASLAALCDSLHTAGQIAITSVAAGATTDGSLLIGAARATGGRAFFADEDHEKGLPAQIGAYMKKRAAPGLIAAKLTLSLPDGVAVTDVWGATYENGQFLFSTLSANDTTDIYFNFINRPARSSRMDLNFTALSPANRAPVQNHTSIEFPRIGGDPSYTTTVAPRLLAYTTWVDMATNAPTILKNRKGFAQAVLDTIATLEIENSRLSGGMTSEIENLKKIQKLLYNGYYDDEVLFKLVQYGFLGMIERRAIKE